jgi:hypothetical protein
MKKSRKNKTNAILALVCVVLVLGILDSLTHTVLGWVFLIFLAAPAASAVFFLKVYPALQKAEAYRATTGGRGQHVGRTVRAVRKRAAQGSGVQNGDDARPQ